MFRASLFLLAAAASGASVDHPHFLQLQLLTGKELQHTPETEAKLDENLRAQEQAKASKRLVSRRDDIDAQAARVANETGSPALAAMLGSMYKDMRTFAKPSHIKYVSQHESKLEAEAADLRAKLAAENAAGNAAVADKKEEADDDEEATTASDDKEVEDDKEDEDKDEETEKEPAPAKKAGSDYNKETEFHEAVPIWPSNSAFPVTVEYAIAFLWVLFVASVPFTLAGVTGKEQTLVDKTLTVTLLIVLFGGLYLFTNIIIFQSAHFSTQRSLTLVECVYMMSQVITTVGYGDITPAKQRGQVFVGFYVITSFLVIAVMMSNLVSHLIQVAKKRFHGDDSATTAQRKEPAAAWMRTKDVISYRNLSFNFLVYFFFAATWSIFFANMPGEGKKWYEAVYMSIITLSTVGFGAFTASTEAGKVFASFWMIFGSLALVAVIGEFTNVMSQQRNNEDFSASVNSDAIADFERKTGQSSMTEGDFIQFYMQNRKLTSQDELEAYRGAFRTLSGKSMLGRNSVSASEIADIVERSASFDQLRRR